MFDNFRNMAGMIGQAKQVQQRMAEIQEELKQRHLVGEAGAGAVRVTVNGSMQVLHVEFDQPMLVALVGEGTEADQAMVQELIVAATNAALDNARAAVRDELRKLTGGMDIPGLDMLIGR